jgi:hypothetical protein
MTDFERGFSAGLEAAAAEVERHKETRSGWVRDVARVEACVIGIRALTPAGPSEATLGAARTKRPKCDVAVCDKSDAGRCDGWRVRAACGWGSAGMTEEEADEAAFAHRQACAGMRPPPRSQARDDR